MGFSLSSYPKKKILINKIRSTVFDRMSGQVAPTTIIVDIITNPTEIYRLRTSTICSTLFKEPDIHKCFQRNGESRDKNINEFNTDRLFASDNGFLIHNGNQKLPF